jgi:hypothetical protein
MEVRDGRVAMESCLVVGEWRWRMGNQTRAKRGVVMVVWDDNGNATGGGRLFQQKYGKGLDSQLNIHSM